MQKQVVTCDICGEEIVPIQSTLGTTYSVYRMELPKIKYSVPNIAVDSTQTKDLCFDCILPFVELFDKMKKENQNDT